MLARFEEHALVVGKAYAACLEVCKLLFLSRFRVRVKLLFPWEGGMLDPESCVSAFRCTACEPGPIPRLGAFRCSARASALLLCVAITAIRVAVVGRSQD